MYIQRTKLKKKTLLAYKLFIIKILPHISRKYPKFVLSHFSSFVCSLLGMLMNSEIP